MRWPITANWRLWRMQGRAFVAPRGFAQNAAGSRDFGLAEREKKKKQPINKNNLTCSETGCDWLDPTLEHNVVPVLSSQRPSDRLSGRERQK